MANEDKKDFNAMLHDSKDMPKFQTITDQKSIEKYGGSRMYFAPPIDYDKVMKLIPYGKVITVGKIREYFADDLACVRYRGHPEKYPCEVDDKECDDNTKPAIPPPFILLKTQCLFGYLRDSVNNSPYDECPIRAVPDSGDQKSRDRKSVV